MTDYAIVPFRSELHAPLVFDSFAATLYGKKGTSGCWPWNAAPTGRWEVTCDFRRRLARGRAAVAEYITEDGPVVAGWAAVDGGELLFAFVKSAYQRAGIATALLAQLGLDMSRRVAVRYWTPSAALIAARDGWTLAPAVEEP